MAGAAAAALATALALAACGGSSNTSSSSTGASPGGATASSASTGSSPATSSSPQQPGSSQGSSKLALSADPSGQLRFNAASLQASAGTVTITMHNPSQLSHSIAIEGNGVTNAGQVVGPDGTSTVSATLKPGTYKFFCTVPGHRQAGMEGTLTVK
jgi:plastocyanin